MKYETSFTVRSYETDGHGYLRPTELIRYLQEVAHRQLLDSGLGYNEMYTEKHQSFVVARMAIEIYAGAATNEVLSGGTWIVEDKGANFPRMYDLYCGDRLISRATSMWALVNTETKKLCMREECDLTKHPFGEALELSIPERLRAPKGVEMKKVATHRVVLSETDINRHMNNAMYASVFFDLIPNAERYRITSINLNFRSEAAYGSDMDIFMSDLIDPEGFDPRAEKVVFFSGENGDKKNITVAFGLVDEGEI